MAKREKVIQFIVAPLEKHQIEVRESELNTNGWRYSLVIDHKNRLVYMESCPTIRATSPARMGIPEMTEEFEHLKSLGYHKMSIDEFRDFCDNYWNS